MMGFEPIPRFSRERILSPLRLPFRHIGAMRATLRGSLSRPRFFARSGYIRKAGATRNH